MCAFRPVNGTPINARFPSQKGLSYDHTCIYGSNRGINNAYYVYTRTWYQEILVVGKLGSSQGILSVRRKKGANIAPSEVRRDPLPSHGRKFGQHL